MYFLHKWQLDVRLSLRNASLSCLLDQSRRNPTNLRLCASLKHKKPFTVQGNFTKVMLTYIALTHKYHQYFFRTCKHFYELLHSYYINQKKKDMNFSIDPIFMLSKITLNFEYITFGFIFARICLYISIINVLTTVFEYFTISLQNI